AGHADPLVSRSPEGRGDIDPNSRRWARSIRQEWEFHDAGRDSGVLPIAGRPLARLVDNWFASGLLGLRISSRGGTATWPGYFTRPGEWRRFRLRGHVRAFPSRFGGREMRPGPRDFGPRDFQLSPEAASLFDQAQTNTFYFTVWSRDGALLKRSTNCPPEVPLPERPGRDTRTHTRMRAARREAFHFTELGDCVLAGRSIVADLNALRGFTGWLLAVGATVLAFGLGGGWWLTARAIRPVEEISAAASRISAGNLSERISVVDPKNELGRLAGVLNSTFARLEAAFAQQKQFTADASHELRTPLAVIISE